MNSKDPIYPTEMHIKNGIKSEKQLTNYTTAHCGIDLRTHFAGIAMQGILSGADINNTNSFFLNNGYIHYETVAKDAVGIADALILELNKTN